MPERSEGVSEEGAGPDAAADGAPDLGEETRRIVAAVQDWMRRAVPAAEPASQASPAAQHTGPECQWCPICQLASVLRGERPDVAEKVAEAGLAVAGALRAIVDAAVAHAPEQQPGEQRAAGPGRRPRPSPVQRIDLDGTGDGTDT